MALEESQFVKPVVMLSRVTASFVLAPPY